MYLRANSNNRAATVLDCFLGAVHELGLPHRVRRDKGGENVEVARLCWSVQNEDVEGDLS